MLKLKALVIFAFSALLFQSNVSAQENSGNSPEMVVEDIDEIIVEGKADWAGHKGMDAFFNGDFETAEIIFEKEFISLKRADNGRYNAAVDAALSISRANNTAQAISNSPSAAASGQGNLVPTLNQSRVNSGLAGNASGKRKKGRNILNDGILSYQDFALTKYMAGLTELQLEKYDEAKKSFKTSLHHDGGNVDARMRLGLLYLMEDNYDKAADQLEKLDRRRVKCKKTRCDEYGEILEAASTLATEITKKIQNK